MRPPLVPAKAGGEKRDARKMVPAINHCFVLFGRTMFNILNRMVFSCNRRTEMVLFDDAAVERFEKRFMDVGEVSLPLVLDLYSIDFKGERRFRSDLPLPFDT